MKFVASAHNDLVRRPCKPPDVCLVGSHSSRLSSSGSGVPAYEGQETNASEIDDDGVQSFVNGQKKSMEFP